MAGVRIGVHEFGSAEAAHDLLAMGGRAADMKPALALVRDLLIKGNAANFASAGAYFDATWPPLAEGTVQRKGDGTLLRDTGALEAAITGGRGRRTSVTRRGVSVGTKLFYARFLHGGTRTGIPARKLVGATQGEVTASAAILKQYVVEGLV